MSANEPEIDYELARAMQLALEAEQAFGIDHLPKGERFQVETSESTSPGEQPAIAPLTPGDAPAPTKPAEEVLVSIGRKAALCTACELCQGRIQVVPGQGNPHARLMFVGEAPGAEEDASGQAFVGKAGQLLTKMIGAMGLSRDEVYIANILKCRPPGNRNPTQEEASACFHFLEKQIETVSPEVICTLGAQASHQLLSSKEPIGRLRGQTFDYQGARLIPTYHPAYLLRDPSQKRAAWQDLQRVMAILGLS